MTINRLMTRWATWRLLSACCAVSDDEDRLHCRMKYCCLSTFRGTATSKKPTIISSEVWSPQMTVRCGSGLCAFLLELSNQAATCSLVPAFKGRGLARVGQLPTEIEVDTQECFD